MEGSQKRGLPKYKTFMYIYLYYVSQRMEGYCADGIKEICCFFLFYRIDIWGIRLRFLNLYINRIFQFPLFYFIIFFYIFFLLLD